MEIADSGVGDFDLFLPSADGVVDVNGVFLEEDTGDFDSYTGVEDTPHTSPGASAASSAFEDFTSFNHQQTNSRSKAGLGTRGSSSSSSNNNNNNTAAAAAAAAAKAAVAKGNNLSNKRNSSKRLAIPIPGGGSILPPMNEYLDSSSRDRDELGKKRSASNSGIDSSGGSGDEDDGDGMGGSDDKKSKRRKQIAAASRASRARRKRELEDLRDENKRLREERSHFLGKIGELQMRVEAMRERGSTDMRVENELLRAQLEEHKRFVSCFKRLCDGAPTSLNARHMIYKQGSDSAHAHVLGLISQSQADDWSEATVPKNYNVPYQHFSMHYKFKTEFGEQTRAGSGSGGSSSENGETLPSGGIASSSSSSTDASSSGTGHVRRRLNVRVDVLFPGLDSNQIAEFFWASFSNTDIQTKLYGVKGIELTQLADDMPDKDTKMIYYREKHAPPKRDVDWVLICNRRRRDLAKSTLEVPLRKPSKPQLGRASTLVMAMSTTQHSVAPHFDNADRITSLFIQGCVAWNVGGDCRLTVVFSFPEDFQVKAVQGFNDIVNEKGVVSEKFLIVLKSFNEMIGEHSVTAPLTT